MLKYLPTATILYLDKEETKLLPEFKDRDIDKLNPTLVAVNTDYKNKSVQIFSQLQTPVGIISSHVISFNGIITEEEVLIVIDEFFKSGIFCWNKLLEEYDQKVASHKNN